MITFKQFFSTHVADNSQYSFSFQKEKDCYEFNRNGRAGFAPIKISTWYSWRDDSDLIHPALAQIAVELNDMLQDESFIETNTYLFDKEEYEHNTRDLFIKYSNPAKSPALHGSYLATGNLVGFVSKKIKNEQFTLQIGSRFGNKFLMSIIADADGFLELKDYGDVSKNGWLEWLLIFLWKTKLKAAYRLGLPKQYVSSNERLQRIRGNIKINHLIGNQELYPPYECSYREHSYDNEVTRLINKTFHSIPHKNMISECNRIHHDFLIATKDKRVPTIQLLKSGRVKNPYYSTYNEVVKLSKMLLKRQTTGFSDNQSDLSAFLFDVSMLFEYFIRKTLTRSGFQLEEKNLETHRISRGNGGTRAIKPDILIRNEQNELEIFDVKYKHFSFSEGVNRDDLYQMHTYLGHFLHNEKVSRCGFIYPITAERLGQREPIIKNIIFQAGKMVDFEIHFFIVPKDKEAEDENYFSAFQFSIHQFVIGFKQ